MPPLPPFRIILFIAEAPPATVNKIQTLAQIADDLRRGEDFNITRLTILKGLCSDPKATAQFALYLAKKTQQAMKSRRCPSYMKPEDWRNYQRLVGKAVRGMAGFLNRRTKAAEGALHDLSLEVRGVQNEYKHIQWGPVRIIHSWEVLIAEKALECVLDSWDSSRLGYEIARDYAKRSDARLIPKSAPLVEDIAEFWGRRFLGRGWKKRLRK